MVMLRKVGSKFVVADQQAWGVRLAWSALVAKSKAAGSIGDLADVKAVISAANKNCSARFRLFVLPVTAARDSSEMFRTVGAAMNEIFAETEPGIFGSGLIDGKGFV